MDMEDLVTSLAEAFGALLPACERDAIGAVYRREIADGTDRDIATRRLYVVLCARIGWRVLETYSGRDLPSPNELAAQVDEGDAERVMH